MFLLLFGYHCIKYLLCSAENKKGFWVDYTLNPTKENKVLFKMKEAIKCRLKNKTKTYLNNVKSLKMRI